MPWGAKYSAMKDGYLAFEVAVLLCHWVLSADHDTPLSFYRTCVAGDPTTGKTAVASQGALSTLDTRTPTLLRVHACDVATSHCFGTPTCANIRSEGPEACQ